jgi:tRNA(Arg) A34 adenosine deaminase TadA
MDKAKQLNKHEVAFMREAISLSASNLGKPSGGPFGAVVVKDGKVVGRGANSVTSTNDPTAHAEVVAIRDACRNLGTFQLDGCDIYSSCEPCPMCLGAIYWARPARLFFAATREDAARAGFDDSYIYQQVALDPDKRDIPTLNIIPEEAVSVFSVWIETDQKILY